MGRNAMEALTSWFDNTVLLAARRFAKETSTMRAWCKVGWKASLE
jgi:hypothetical protein